MDIKINDIIINDVWDYQRAYLLLKLQGLSGDVLSAEDRDTLTKQVSNFMWTRIDTEFPRIGEICTGKTGQFNEMDARHHHTPIIAIQGHFYIQLVVESNDDAWMWEPINLQPYRFYFNEVGYFKGLILDAIGKAVITHGPKVLSRFTKLLDTLGIELSHQLKRFVTSDDEN